MSIFREVLGEHPKISLEIQEDNKTPANATTR
jgi:hypothetical protein